MKDAKTLGLLTRYSELFERIEVNQLERLHRSSGALQFPDEPHPSTAKKPL
jgi:hypothetical protein